MINVLKMTEGSINDYEIEVKISRTQVFYISVSLGDKKHQTSAGINVAATGRILLEDIPEFIKAINLANSLVNKEVELKFSA